MSLPTLFWNPNSGMSAMHACLQFLCVYYHATAYSTLPHDRLKNLRNTISTTIASPNEQVFMIQTLRLLHLNGMLLLQGSKSWPADTHKGKESAIPLRLLESTWIYRIALFPYQYYSTLPCNCSYITTKVDHKSCLCSMYSWSNTKF